MPWNKQKLVGKPQSAPRLEIFQPRECRLAVRIPIAIHMDFLNPRGSLVKKAIAVPVKQPMLYMPTINPRTAEPG